MLDRSVQKQPFVTHELEIRRVVVRSAQRIGVGIAEIFAQAVVFAREKPFHALRLENARRIDVLLLDVFVAVGHHIIDIRYHARDGVS